jgi:hypothetical protein
MFPRHCYTDIRSVWSVRGTVSNFLRRIADFGSHFLYLQSHAPFQADVTGQGTG